ncbi:SDR family oxidoreductase [Streptomyces violaceus]|uniref:SDR family NAD(P)-dependent oxidoreductase n=1 Tax=Streptomyces violaceus TaxID=1936 RepID=A0ABZ1NKD1_STRVL
MLVNNAGILEWGTIEEQSLESFRRVIDVNVQGAWLGMRTTVPSIRRAGGGVILNISSIAGITGYAGIGGYVTDSRTLTFHSPTWWRMTPSARARGHLCNPGEPPTHRPLRRCRRLRNFACVCLPPTARPAQGRSEDVDLVPGFTRDVTGLGHRGTRSGIWSVLRTVWSGPERKKSQLLAATVRGLRCTGMKRVGTLAAQYLDARCRQELLNSAQAWLRSWAPRP